MKRLRELIRSEIDELEEELANLQKNAPEGIKKAEKAYNLAAEIVNIFKDGTKEEKIEALEETGSNLTLKDKKVEILSQNHFALIIDGLSRAKEQNKAFEPAKIRGLNEQNEAFASVRTTLLRG